ncbi:MAG TPA: GRP family sugar transporter [Acidobacteriaceae bacterium]|jgi:glucose uptake protein|nr:GRP family sugar transporter [Acidobacteriaceae bacterium]
MFVPVTFATALVMMIASTVCWGSWANTFKVTRNYRFELFYWDYSIGVVLISVLCAFTMGATQPGPLSFVNNLHSASWSNILCAGFGGFIFNIANVLLVAGIDIAGLAIAFPLSIGIALVEGVLLSYMIQPKGQLGLLLGGVVMALAAVVLIGRAYGSMNASGRTTSKKGIRICVISGLLMGAFAPFNTRALTAAHPLTPYGIVVCFAIGAFICCFVFNTWLMRRPLSGTPVRFSEYFRVGASQHALGLLGGVIWGVGIVFNMVAANLVGVSISYAIGQASPMIAALWGLLVWHEFRGADRRARLYLAGMFCCYAVALVLVSEAYHFS